MTDKIIRVRFIKDIDGGAFAFVGEIWNLDEKQAEFFIAKGFAELVESTTLYERMLRYNPDLTGATYQSLINALYAERDRVYGTTLITEEDK